MISFKVVMDKFWTECKYIMKARSPIDKTKKKTGTNHMLQVQTTTQIQSDEKQE